MVLTELNMKRIYLFCAYFFFSPLTIWEKKDTLYSSFHTVENSMLY